MADIIELSELDFNDNFEGNTNNEWDKKSSNFGGGLEFLMNDKNKENSKSTSDINLDDLNNLENELNNLVDDIPSTSFRPNSDMFSSPSSMFEDKPSVKFSDGPSIGKSTSNISGDAKTWDGYGKFNNVP